MALNYFRLLLVFAIYLVARAAAGDVLQVSPESLGLSSTRLLSMDEYYRAKVEKGEMAGIVLLVAREGKIAHLSAIGYADRERKQQLHTDSIFRLYSMTKPIASVALMMLYEQGLFQLDDPVAKYIPEFANLRVLRTPDAPLDDTVALERPPTVIDLLRNTAGLPHGLENSAVDREYLKQDVFGNDTSLKEMMRKISKIPLIRQPGKGYVYGVSQDVQARLVEVLSGMAFDDFLEQRLFTPLGMKDAGFWVSTEKASRLAKVHWDKQGELVPLDDAHGFPKAGTFLSEPWSVNSYTQNHKRKGGSYGLVGTAEDYWRFAQMLADHGKLGSTRILSPTTVEYMLRDHSKSVDMFDVRGNRLGVAMGTAWGLGLAVMRDPVKAGYISREGILLWGGAAGTYFFVDPQKNIVAVALTQHMAAPKLGPLWAQIPTFVYSALME